MNKGFTLVELLAVIIILGVLTLVTVVSVNPILKDAKKGLSDAQINNIEEVASLYYIKYGVGLDDFELENPKDCINVSELIESGYIENDEVTNPKTGEKILGSVKVTYNSNNYIYEYQDNTCTNYDKGIICERVGNTELGQVPEGKFLAGDAYNCKVDPNKEPYKFYILTTPSEDSDMVNLIMDQNINSDGTPAGTIPIEKNENNVYNLVEWITDEKYYEDVGGVIPDEVLNDKGDCQYGNSCALNDKGPLTAMNFLQEATKNWTNTNEMTINTYTDETGTPLKQMDEFKTYARLPIYLSETTKTEVTRETNASYLYENLGLYCEYSPNGYWTLSSYTGDSNYAWVVYCNGDMYQGFMNMRFHGVRPVISMYKFQME